MQEGDDVSSPAAAIKFLRNRHNLEQPVFPNSHDIRTEEATKDGHTTKTEYRTSSGALLKDRITQIMHMLEQLLDHQATLDSYSAGIPLKLTPRSKLEGYRFMDLAARRPLTLRVVSLGAFRGAGKSWVDFTRAIKAVTLFGEGFGDLLERSAGASNGVRSRWERLPKHRDHLAVSTYDLAQIIRQEGSAASSPVKLAPGIYWPKAGAAFAPCLCREDGALVVLPVVRRCDRAQVLLPHNLLRGVASNVDTATLRSMLASDGAVVFGRSEILA